MLKKTLLIVWLLVSFSFLTKCEEECRFGHFSFIRIVNTRPSEDILSNLIVSKYSSLSSCYHQCHSDLNCSAYFVDHYRKECVFIMSFHLDMLSSNLEVSSNWSFHKKFCIPFETSCKYHWAIESLRFLQLKGVKSKKLIGNFTEEECVLACLNEAQFICRSASYNFQTNECSLNQHDRHTSPQVFKRISNPNLYYFENQCINESKKCTFHKKKGYRSSSIFFYSTFQSNSLLDCESECLNYQDFNCRLYSFNNNQCSLSPFDVNFFEENIITTNYRQNLNHNEDAVYEKSFCLDVEIHCKSDSMTAVIKTGGFFQGKVFTLSHPSECYNIGKETETIALSVPLHGRQCGTLNMGNGTFTNSLIVQQHPIVLRDSDRRIDIACDYHQLKMKIKSKKQSITDDDTIAITQVVTGLVQTPEVRMKIINSNGDEVKGVELGDFIYLKVEMVDESIFDMFGSQLIAINGQGNENLTLINSKGCPVEPDIFPAFTHQSDKFKSLIAPFQAFRFTNDSSVKFTLLVSFCLDSCQPVFCGTSTNDSIFRQKSYGRKRRSLLQFEKFFGSSFSNNTLSSFVNIESHDILSDVKMETSFYVVSNLKSLDLTNEEKELEQLKKELSYLFPNHPSLSFHFNPEGVCFSPLLMFSLATFGIVLQFFLFLIYFWIAVINLKNKFNRNIQKSSLSNKMELYRFNS